MSVLKAVEFPDKSFASKDELMSCLKEHKDEIIKLKKAEIHKTDSLIVPFGTVKSDAEKGMRMKDGYVYAVINTTKIMDSHNDVHIDGIWRKSIDEQQGKIYYVADHDLKVTSVIAFPQNVAVMTKSFSFKELGFELEGTTQALVFEVDKSKIRLPQALDIIDEKIPIEHSVRMQYVSLCLCANYSGDDWEQERENWDKYYSSVANKERADEIGYFWAVTEAKIYKEGSMVLAGSNSVTPLLQKNIEAVQAKEFFINLLN
jgi:hypothetical protein